MREIAFKNNTNLSVFCSKAADTLGRSSFLKAVASATNHHSNLKHINTSAVWSGASPRWAACPAQGAAGPQTHNHRADQKAAYKGAFKLGSP